VPPNVEILEIEYARVATLIAKDVHRSVFKAHISIKGASKMLSLVTTLGVGNRFNHFKRSVRTFSEDPLPNSPARSFRVGAALRHIEENQVLVIVADRHEFGSLSMGE
jgi:hypothetical protein